MALKNRVKSSGVATLENKWHSHKKKCVAHTMPCSVTIILQFGFKTVRYTQTNMY